MRIYSMWSVVVGLGAVACSASAADISGKVTLKGTPKPEITIDMAADPKCAAIHEKAVSTRHYLVGSDGGLANVLVYVKSGVPQKEYPVPAEAVELNQEGCLYLPYVLGLQVNQKLKIKNSDPTLHNVHATPKAGSGNKEFNFAQPVQGMTTEKTFTAAEVPVRFKCDVHPWMFAYVGVFDHPFFAVTDKDGKFTIKGLPAGTYTLEAYHVKTHGANPGVTQEVKVDGDAKADFTVELK